MIQPIISTPPSSPMIPIANQTVQPRQGLQPFFDMELSKPPNPTLQLSAVKPWFKHPVNNTLLTYTLWQNPSTTESFNTRLGWYQSIQDALSPEGQKYLASQLKKGRLLDMQADDGKSTLAHLYSILSLPRAEGFNAKNILEETLRHLNEPVTVTQKFGELSNDTIQKLLAYYQSGAGPKITDKIDPEQMRHTFSSECPSASQMVDMLDKAPSEFVREIADLTSPRLCFWKKTWHTDISPEDPSKAAAKLKEAGIPAMAVPGTNGAQYYVQVKLPYSGYLRALNQQGKTDLNVRSVVESAYQDALTCLVEPTYDAGLGMLVKPDGTLGHFDGLIADQTSLMESILSHAKISVPFQFILSDKENEPFLMGYTRNFEQTAKDIVTALRDYKTNVLVGIVDTDKSDKAGWLDMKHEFTITGYSYEKNPQTGQEELVFKVVDTDDNNPEFVTWPARKLIPMIHHAVLPAQEAKQITAQINALPQNQYMLPDKKDAEKFQLIATVPPEKQQAFVADFERRNQAEEAQKAQAANPTLVTQPVSIVPTQPNLAYATYPGTYQQPYYYAQA